jgi:hypothetical protein
MICSVCNREVNICWVTGSYEQICFKCIPVPYTDLNMEQDEAREYYGKLAIQHRNELTELTESN